MEDEKLLKISLITASIGIFLLFFIFQFLDHKTYKLEEVESLDDNEEFYVYGFVERIKETDKVAMLDLVEMKKIKQKAVYFKSENISINITEKDYVKIRGSKYEGKIVIDKMSLLQNIPS